MTIYNKRQVTPINFIYEKDRVLRNTFGFRISISANSSLLVVSGYVTNVEYFDCTGVDLHTWQPIFKWRLQQCSRILFCPSVAPTYYTSQFAFMNTSTAEILCFDTSQIIFHNFFAYPGLASKYNEASSAKVCDTKYSIVFLG